MLLLFDLNGTLLDPSGIGDPWAAPDLGAAVLQGAVQTAMVDALTGDFRPFDEHVRAAIVLEVALRGLAVDRIDAAVQRAEALDPCPGAADLLDSARQVGHRVAVLSNSGRASAEAAIERAGLRVEAVVGVDEVQAYKPHPAPYRHALDRLGATGEDTMLVAAHAWDVTGAARAGLRTAWVAHAERELTPAAPAPELRAASLTELAEMLATGAVGALGAG